jgi:hypothetical protein
MIDNDYEYDHLLSQQLQDDYTKEASKFDKIQAILVDELEDLTDDLIYFGEEL